MALVLDATVGGANANAYATALAAIAVASYRVGGDKFVALTSDQQVQALVTAASDIDSIENVSPGFIGGFVGERASATQAMAWPRSGTQFGTASLPPTLVRANIELAIVYAPQFAAGSAGDVLNEDPNIGNIKRKKTDVLEKEYFAPRFQAPMATQATAIQRFPAYVQRLLVPLVVVASSFWREGSGVVSRGS